MNLAELNRFVLLILMCYLIYTIYMFNKKLDVDVEISKSKLEVVYLEKEEKQLNIQINKKFINKLDKEIKD